MNCNYKLLQMYVDDRAEEPVATLLAEHLKRCGPCRRELTRLKALDWDLRNRPKAAAPAELGALRRAVLDDCFAEANAGRENSFGTSDLLYLQATIWKGTTAFMNLLSGNGIRRKRVRRRRSAKKQSVLRALLRRAIGF